MRVLSDKTMHDLWVTHRVSFDAIRAIEAAVLEELAKQEPVAWWCEGYFDDEEEAQNYCDTKAQIAESITPLFATTTNHRY